MKTSGSSEKRSENRKKTSGHRGRQLRRFGNSLWNSFKIAFAMFSKIPVPQAEWTRENMKYMFCFLPFVGAVIGGLSLAVSYAWTRFQFRNGFAAAVLVVIPVAVSGGLHLDGLLDTADAMSSWREKDRRLEILKDSNAGAFAVITAAVYFLLLYGAYFQIGNNFYVMCVMAAGFVISRCLGGLCAICIPPAKADGTGAEFARKSGDRAVRNVLIVYLLAMLALMIWVDPVLAAAVSVTAAGVYAYHYHTVMKYFGGTTGDLNGCLICLCEAAFALVLAVVSNFL